jgi:hypothetical protein
MTVVIDGTNGITTPDVDSGPVSGTNLSYTGTLTGGTGVVNLGSGQFYKDASGNVGIGTSSPASTLSVVGPSNARAILAQAPSNISAAYLTFRDDQGLENAFVGNQARTSGGSVLVFGTTTSGNTSATERMRIDSSGRLLVGTTSAIAASAANLQVTGNTSTPAFAFNRTDNGGIGYFYRGGSGPVGEISVTTTSTSYVTSSDYRLKHDIQPMTGALAKVAALKPCTYKWNADDSNGEGFIAHELQEVCPSAVTGEKDAVDAEGKPVYQGIDTSFVVPLLTAALQEAVAKIESLTARIEALENQA